MEQMAGTRNYQSIGEVLVSVKTEFPDITISKIRFLEAEGLIEPERTPSGYRKFYVDDVDRLKSILRMQRDEYLPLKVIKERLLTQDAADVAGEGLEGAELDADLDDEADAATATAEIADAPTGLQMSIEEMSAATGVERDRIKELESFGIVCSHGPDGAKYYDGDDYIILSIVKDFFRFGIEPRHLTMYKHFADRETSFFEALVAPTLRQKNPDARKAAAQTLTDLSVTSRKFKQALLRTNLRNDLQSA
jgi:DNA-binding transcriptional MerR regulator